MATHLPSPASPFDSTLEVEESTTTAGETCVHLFYVAITEGAYEADDSSLTAPRDRVLVATVTPELLRTYPINVLRGAPDYLKPKYGTVTTISFMRGSFGWDLPHDETDASGLLESLPAGFSKEVKYGLGLKWEYRFIAETISKIEGITEIVLVDGSESSLETPLYALGLKLYDQLRRGIGNITRRNQQNAHEEKRLLAYSSLLNKVAPDRYPPRAKKIRPGAVYELVKISAEKSSFSREDRLAAVDLVKAQSEAISKTNAAELLSLRTDIERVTLAALIQRFEEMLSKDLPEQRWQAFLKTNPFILSLAFALPVFLVQDQAYIGGGNFRGAGEKIADFLAAQHYTGNLALIEIKAPRVPLLAALPYRMDIFAPSKEVSGAISQLLDQRFKLQTNFATKAYSSELTDVHPYAVQCILIAGSSPDSRVEKKSLELFRHATKDVVIVTFNELLHKLKSIQEVLAHGDSQDANPLAMASLNDDEL